MPQKKAVLVGIDLYPYPPNNLNSCVADTMAFRRMLLDVYGFADDDVTLIHNQDATYANATDAIASLVAGAATGDQLVFFESSHGYQYPRGNTLVQCLCLYDKFFDDTDLVARTASVPDGVLTVVLDACHSGGMDKLFFPPGGPALARAKVYQPSPDELLARTGLTQQVTSFRLFGRAATAANDVLATAVDPTKQFTFPRAKDSVASTLQGTLFTACRADQTAAAGSLATDNLSAFTYALTTQLDPDVSLNDLCSMVTARLEELNMSQQPVLVPPVADAILAERTFITGGEATHGPSQKDLGAGAQPQPPAGPQPPGDALSLDGVIARIVDGLRGSAAAAATGNGNTVTLPR